VNSDYEDRFANALKASDRIGIITSAAIYSVPLCELYPAVRDRAGRDDAFETVAQFGSASTNKQPV
jgi:hypothetical protein